MKKTEKDQEIINGMLDNINNEISNFTGEYDHAKTIQTLINTYETFIETKPVKYTGGDNNES